MTIPLNPAVPNLPLAPLEYEQAAQNQLANVLRLYFNQINHSNNAVLSQISTTQTLTWLGV
jgi:hypothetical protein